jgi:hypothetical protein
MRPNKSLGAQHNQLVKHNLLQTGDIIMSKSFSKLFLTLGVAATTVQFSQAAPPNVRGLNPSNGAGKQIQNSGFAGNRLGNAIQPNVVKPQVLQATPIKPNFTPNLGSNVIKPNLGSVVNNKPLNPQVIQNPILSGNLGNKVPVPVKPLPGNVVNPGIVNKLPNNVFQNINVKPLPVKPQMPNLNTIGNVNKLPNLTLKPVPSGGFGGVAKCYYPGKYGWPGYGYGFGCSQPWWFGYGCGWGLGWGGYHHHHHCWWNCYDPCYSYNYCTPVYYSTPVVYSGASLVTPVNETTINLTSLTTPVTTASTTGADLQVLEVKQIEAGNASLNQGPLMLVTIKNVGQATATKFTLGLFAGLQAEPNADMIPAMREIQELAAGATHTLEVRLPVDVLKMNTTDGTGFKTLFAVTDVQNTVTENNEQNNVLAIKSTDLSK